MKPTIEELIFAAHMRARVKELRAAKTADLTEEERAAFNAEPVNDLIEEAMTELTAFTTVIRAWQAKNPPTETP